MLFTPYLHTQASQGRLVPPKHNRGAAGDVEGGPAGATSHLCLLHHHLLPAPVVHTVQGVPGQCPLSIPGHCDDGAAKHGMGVHADPHDKGAPAGLGPNPCTTAVPQGTHTGLSNPARGIGGDGKGRQWGVNLPPPAFRNTCTRTPFSLLARLAFPPSPPSPHMQIDITGTPSQTLHADPPSAAKEDGRSHTAWSPTDFTSRPPDHR
jgi:hypothetical protein